MSQGNHLNLDLGSTRIIFLDRSVFGAKSNDTRTEDGNRLLHQQACVESGVIKKFLHSGKEVQLLTPKKDEMDLWTVVLENSNGESYWRLDMIVASQPMPAPAPNKLGEAVREANQEFIPLEEA